MIKIRKTSKRKCRCKICTSRDILYKVFFNGNRDIKELKNFSKDSITICHKCLYRLRNEISNALEIDDVTESRKQLEREHKRYTQGYWAGKKTAVTNIINEWNKLHSKFKNSQSVYKFHECLNKYFKELQKQLEKKVK